MSRDCLFPVCMTAGFCYATRFFLFMLQKILQGIACCSQGVRNFPVTYLNSEESAEALTEELFEELARLWREGRKGGRK